MSDQELTPQQRGAITRAENNGGVHPGGRPTDYDPAMCGQVVVWGAEGMSKAEIAHNLNIARGTMARWEAEKPEFKEAMARAKLAEQAWWERMGRTNLTAQTFQASMWSRSMAARFPDDWRESRDDKVTHGADASFSRFLTQIATDSVFPSNAERRSDDSEESAQ